jgi:hypothetical protein
VLIVSPSFPPMNSPDMQRVRMSLPCYSEYGWEPVVLTVAPEFQQGSREDELLTTVPDGITIFRTGAFSLKWSRRFGVGNLGLRSWCHLFFAGNRILRQGKIDLVFFSNTQFVTFTLGRIWRFLHGVPYVIDLQDPWRTDYYERPGSRRPPGGWKYQFARLQAWLLERWSFRRMSGFISVSRQYIDDLRKRYHWFATIPCDEIRFGASEADLVSARCLPAGRYAKKERADSVRLIYTGAAGPIMPHSLSVLFGGLKQFRLKDPAGASRLSFEFLGTSYAAPGQGQKTVIPVAESFGVADQVLEVEHRLGHLECLQIQASADVLLVLGSSDFAYSPSKLYPYYLAGQPMLAVVFRESFLEAILHRLSCAVVVGFAEAEPKEKAYDELCDFFNNALNKFPAGSLPKRNDALFRQEYLARTLTGRQCALFDQAVLRAVPQQRPAR